MADKLATHDRITAATAQRDDFLCLDWDFAMPHKPQKQPPPEFVKEIAEGVGRIIIAASQIEHQLGITLAEMFKMNRLQHRSFIIPMSVSNKINLLRQLG
jgi:hypothetical protein